MIGFIKTMIIFNILDSIFSFLSTKINMSILKDRIKELDSINIKSKYVYEDLCGHMIDYIEQYVFNNEDDIKIMNEIDLSDINEIIKIIPAEYFLIKSTVGSEIAAMEVYFNVFNSPFKRRESLKRAIAIYTVAKQCNFDPNVMKEYFDKIIGN